MISDGQVKELRRLLLRGKSLGLCARMTEMSDKTARDYRDDDRLPSQRKTQRDYRTRTDPFAEVLERLLTFFVLSSRKRFSSSEQVSSFHLEFRFLQNQTVSETVIQR